MRENYRPLVPKYARVVSIYNDERTVLISFSSSVYTDPFEEIAINEEAVYELKSNLDDIINMWKEEELQNRRCDMVEKPILDYDKMLGKKDKL